VTKEPLLRVNNLEVVYNHTVQVLKGLSLAVPEGQVVALLGSNGAGKSTTLKAISGLLPMEDGEVTDGEIRFGYSVTIWLQSHFGMPAFSGRSPIPLGGPSWIC